MTLARRVAILLVLLLTANLRAADWPVARGPSNEPAPFKYDPAAWKKVPRDFLEDAPACILYAATTHLLDEDGTVETISHEVTRFNGRKAIDKLGEYHNITFDPSYEKLTLNEARVHKPDGRTVPIEPKHLQLRDLSTDYQVYDSDKQLIISFPNLEVGDVIEVKWTVKGKNPEYRGQFFYRYNFGDDSNPIVRDELRVRVKKDQTFRYASTGGKLEPKVTEENGERFYLWTVDNRKQLPQDSELPSKELFRLQVSLSTFGSWEEVGKWKLRLRAECWDCTEEMRAVVKRVTAKLDTPLEKARALTYWVRRNIRYVSAGEKHAFTPHKPVQVLLNRYGDCKDQTQLLAVMLREANVPVLLATLGVQDDGQVIEDLPSPWGTHAILLVPLDDGDHWIDTTSSLSTWDVLPRDDRDRLCYLIDEKGDLKLKRTPPLTADDNRIEQTTHVRVGADGSSRSERTMTFAGNAALAQREAWVDVPAGERRRLMANELQDAHSRSKLLRLEIDEKQLQDFDRPVTAKVVFEIQGHFSGDPDREGNVSDSKVWSKLLSYNVDFDRSVPLDLWAPVDLTHRYVIDLHPAFEFDGLPRNKDIASQWGRFTMKAKADPKNARHIELEFHTRIEKSRVEPPDFDAFRKWNEEVMRAYRVWMVLKSADSLPDASLLDAVVTLDPDDSGTALTLAQLFVKHVMFDEARRVLKRARYYRPGDASLWEMTVKVAKGPEEEEAAYREMIKRFPNEPKYSVSLGATLIALGKHQEAKEVLLPVARNGSGTVRGNANYQLARNAAEQKDPEAAIKYLDAAEEADGDLVTTATALLFRARVLEQMDKHDDAIAACKLALASEPQSTAALGNLVRLTLDLDKTDEALDYLRRYTAAIGSTDPDAMASAAAWHLRLGRYDDAFELASRARAIRADEKAQGVLGMVHAHRGEYEKAIFHLGKAKLRGEVLDAFVRANLMLGNLGEAEAAVKNADKRLVEKVKELGKRRDEIFQKAKFPVANQDAWFRAAEFAACAEYAYATAGAGAPVAKLLEGAFKDNVEYGSACALRALLSLEHGRLMKALADSDRAVSLAPDEARGWYVRGRVRLERGAEGAVSDLEKAITLSKRKDAEILHWLASALAQADRLSDAVTAEQEAVKLRPNDAEMGTQLRELEKLAAQKKSKVGN